VASTPEVQPAPAGQATTAGAAETTVTATPAPPAAPAAPPPTIKPAVAGAARSKAPNSKSSAPNSKSSAKNPPTDEPTTPTATPPAIPPATQASVAKAPEKPPAPPALDLASLEQRLRDTHAIGIFTKLSLKNQVDDLLGAFRAFHGGQDKISLADLRQRYDLLLLKVLTLLQDGDPPLASAISASREALWGVLADREKFQKIQLG
jgi:hypothetical protein